MIGKVITLENHEKYFILLKEIIESHEFLVGIKLIDEKYTNEFKLFLEKNDKDELCFEVINDEELLKVIVNNYVLNNMD